MSRKLDSAIKTRKIQSEGSVESVILQHAWLNKYI